MIVSSRDWRKAVIPWALVGILAYAAAGPSAAWAQGAAPARLVGQIKERQLDIRPDSGERLLGLVQVRSDGQQNLAVLSAFLPARTSTQTVCMRARNRDGTYAADGSLTAPRGDGGELKVESAGFPHVAASKGLEKTRPEDLGVLFSASPCDDRHAAAYAASFGTPGDVLIAVMNLGSLRATPTARLEPSGRDGTCRQLQGRSQSFNVLCRFDLPKAFAGGRQTLTADFLPVGNPGDRAEFTIWTAPVR